MLHSMHKWSLNSFTCARTFWLLPGLSCLNAAVCTLVCIVAVVQSLPGQLIAGHTIRQKANEQQVRLPLWGCRCDLLPADRPAQQTPELPLVFRPRVRCVFAAPPRDNKNPSLPSPRQCVQHYCDSCKNRTTQNQREKRRPSLGHVRGKETNLTHLSTQPGGYRNSLVSTIGAQPAETWCPNQGSCHPGCRVWGGGFTLETVDIWPQVQDLGGGSPWRLDVWARVQGLGMVWVSLQARGSGSCM